MKCIKNSDGKITRVSDKLAEILVNDNRATFVSKQLWKTEVRDVVIKSTVPTVDSDKISDEKIVVEKPKKKKRKQPKNKKELRSERNKEKK